MRSRRNQKGTAPPIGDRLLTLREAAEVVRLSRQALVRWKQTRESCRASLRKLTLGSQPRRSGHLKRVAGNSTKTLSRARVELIARDRAK